MLFIYKSKKTDLFQHDAFAVGHNGRGAVSPGELEEGAFSRAGEHHGAVVLDRLRQVGLDGHIGHRLCRKEQGGRFA